MHVATYYTCMSLEEVHTHSYQFTGLNVCTYTGIKGEKRDKGEKGDRGSSGGSSPGSGRPTKPTERPLCPGC